MSTEPCREHFRLFSYLSMTIVAIAIMVGMFLLLQHFEEENDTAKSLANQKSLINATNHIAKNQNLIKVVINETRRDNTAFFKILDDMAKAEIDDDKREAAIGAHFNERLDNITEKIDNLTKMVHDMMF